MRDKAEGQKGNMHKKVRNAEVKDGFDSDGFVRDSEETVEEVKASKSRDGLRDDSNWSGNNIDVHIYLKD